MQDKALGSAKPAVGPISTELDHENRFIKFFPFDTALSEKLVKRHQ